jgi:hypothetical protein
VPCDESQQDLQYVSIKFANLMEVMLRKCINWSNEVNSKLDELQFIDRKKLDQKVFTTFLTKV